MGSTLKVDNIVGTSGTSAPITLSGDTATLGSGVTIGDSVKSIIEYDEWVLTSNQTGNDNPIVSWSRNSNSGFDKIGTGVAETSSNSGIFYFPKTGFYRIDFNAYTQHINSSDVVGNVSLDHIPDLSDTTTYSEVARISSPFIATNYQSLHFNFVMIKITTSGSSGQGIKFRSHSFASSNELLGNSRDTKFAVMRLGGV
tara:strand:+ start:476 stop:1072 length:597 start_codon:yes stop_codon:yes gene_type:complete